MDLAEAATIPLAAATAWLAMFSSGCLNMPKSGGVGGEPSLLVWGGSCKLRFDARSALHPSTLCRTGDY